MSETLTRLETFIENWREPLSKRADLRFHTASRKGLDGAPTQIADRIASAHGYKAIGFDWELLDPAADETAPRSALGAFGDALSKDLTMRADWLGRDAALACGREFVHAFAPSAATLLTNHIVRDGGKSEGWNPISLAPYEWAFVGFDDSAIALLVLTGED